MDKSPCQLVNLMMMPLRHHACAGGQTHLCGSVCHHLVASLKTGEDLYAASVGGTRLDLHAAVDVGSGLNINKKEPASVTASEGTASTPLRCAP